MAFLIQARARVHNLCTRSPTLIKQRVESWARQTLSISTRRRLTRFTCWPPIGWAHLGSLRRLTPISPHWGNERGLPIDRYYIQQFIRANALDIRGHGLEIKEDLYASRFGGERITKLDILHPEEGNPNATLVADLTLADDLPSNNFDFIIATQTLHFISDVHAAVGTLFRILKPGGILLATVSGISKISREDIDRWGHNAAFTSTSAERLFHVFFPKGNVRVDARGNVLAAIACLHGLASEELRPQELNYYDPDFQVLVTIRAVKPEMAA
jgi:SAM-dependent methyltransferase